MLHLKRNAAWLLSCRVVADLLNILLFFVVSRQFGPQGVGVYAYGFAIAGFVYSATMLGIDEYGIREYTRTAPGKRAQLIAHLLGAQTCIGGIVLLVLAAFLLITQPAPATLAIILSLTVYQLSTALASTLFVPAMAEQKMARPAATLLLCRAVALLAAAVLVWIVETSLQVALTAFAVAGVLLLVFSALSAASHHVPVRVHWSRETLRDGASTLWSFAAAELMTQGILRIGVIVLSLGASEKAAGIYATGLKLVEAVCLPLWYMGVAAYPGLCHAFQDRTKFVHYSRLTIGIGVGLSAAGALATYLLVPPLLVPLFGPGYEGAQQIVATMAASLVFVRGVEIALGRLMLAANLNVARAAWLGCGALVCITSTIVAAPAFGIEAAVASVVVAFVLVDLLYAISLNGARNGKASVQAAVQGRVAP